MRIFIVTVKLDKDPHHNPRAKVTGECRMRRNMNCTDVTGEHHSILMAAVSRERVAEVLARKGIRHITRIEELQREEVELALES